MSSYPDVQQALVGWLATDLGVRGVTELPADLADQLDLVQVQPLPSSDAVLTIERVPLDVICFSTDLPSARALSIRVRAAIRYQLPGQILDGGVVIRTQTSGGTWHPYTDINVRAWTATHTLTISTHL